MRLPGPPPPGPDSCARGDQLSCRGAECRGDVGEIGGHGGGLDTGVGLGLAGLVGVSDDGNPGQVPGEHIGGGVADQDTLSVLGVQKPNGLADPVGGPPKSAAGRRTVQLPPLIIPSLRNHLDRYAQPDDDGLVFASPRGTRLRRRNFRRRVWLPALSKAGLPEIHFHDLRPATAGLLGSARVGCCCGQAWWSAWSRPRPH